ncbi:MAG: hypothetical protein GY940_41910 [bacterium]|nr:hypothetical protein [bacterium]
MLTFISCSGGGSGQPGSQAASDSIEELLKEAFDAIKAGDWNAYSSLTITSADFVLRASGISKFQEKQSYVGSSVKPTEIKRQAEQFHYASKGEEDCILFHKDSFVSTGRLMLTGTHKTLNNVNIPFQSFTIKVKSAEGEIIDNLYPQVVVVKWGDYYRILKLLFPAGTKKKE